MEKLEKLDKAAPGVDENQNQLPKTWELNGLCNPPALHTFASCFAPLFNSVGSLGLEFNSSLTKSGTTAVLFPLFKSFSSQIATVIGGVLTRAES